MDIHGKSVDMDMDMDKQLHIHGKPGNPELAELESIQQFTELHSMWISSELKPDFEVSSKHKWVNVQPIQHIRQFCKEADSDSSRASTIP